MQGCEPGLDAKELSEADGRWDSGGSRLFSSARHGNFSHHVTICRPLGPGSLTASYKTERMQAKEES